MSELIQAYNITQDQLIKYAQANNEIGKAEAIEFAAGLLLEQGCKLFGKREDEAASIYREASEFLRRQIEGGATKLRHQEADDIYQKVIGCSAV